MNRALKKSLALGAGLLVLSSSLVVAQDAPESLLPPGFDDPAPAPTPAPAPAPAATPQATQPTRPSAPSGSSPVVQSIPGGTSAPVSAPALPSNLPSLAELEELDPDELDELLGLKPKFDVPPAARRSLETVGILAAEEGGLSAASLRNQPASIVRAALTGNKGPVVSRWGHILLRRALVSRLAAPDGMNPAEFAGLRAGLLNRMGEYGAAKTLAQDVDTDNWNERLAGAAVQSYISTGDIVGACPLARFQSDLRDDAEWQMLRSICAAYAGESSRARSDLRRLRSREDTAEIDVLLAQRYAGAAGRGGSAVNLEWEGVDALTPWRFSLANAVGAEIPQNLLEGAGAYYQRVAAKAPMLPLAQRIGGAELAAREGILSSAALIDLYSALYAEQGRDGEAGLRAARLREAYVGADPATRLAAIRDIWTTSEQTDYARQVLTAYAAARLPANAGMVDDAFELIASMLTAGLDRDALEWGEVVPVGSHAWALLALSQPQRSTPVGSGPVDDFYSDDESTDQRKTGFLVAGLAGLGRLETTARDEYDQDLDLGLDRSTRWSQLIQQAASVGNQPLVAMLAGVGMQGTGWEKMTARHLFHIVSALDQVGLSDEARMIAAEAVARG